MLSPKQGLEIKKERRTRFIPLEGLNTRGRRRRAVDARNSYTEAIFIYHALSPDHTLLIFSHYPLLEFSLRN